MLVYSQNKQGIPSDIFKKMNHEGIIRFGSILIAAVQLLKFSALRLMLPKVFSGLHSVAIGLVMGAGSGAWSSFPCRWRPLFSLNWTSDMHNAEFARTTLSQLGFPCSSRRSCWRKLRSCNPVYSMVQQYLVTIARLKI